MSTLGLSTADKGRTPGVIEACLLLAIFLQLWLILPVLLLVATGWLALYLVLRYLPSFQAARRFVGHSKSSIYLATGRHAGAVALLERLRADDPEEAAYVLALAECYATMGARDQALALLKHLPVSDDPQEEVRREKAIVAILEFWLQQHGTFTGSAGVEVSEPTARPESALRKDFPSTN